MEKKIIWRNVCLEQQFHIGQIARFFDLPASTLRYWDEVGILTPHKNHTNSYREYTVSDLMTISDIIFYKNLGISLQQSGAMEQAEPEEHTLLLCGKIEELERQQLEIAQRIQKLHNHLAAIETLGKLRQCPFSAAEIDTDCIVSFDLNEIDKLRQYMENPLSLFPGAALRLSSNRTSWLDRTACAAFCHSVRSNSVGAFCGFPIRRLSGAGIGTGRLPQQSARTALAHPEKPSNWHDHQPLFAPCCCGGRGL